MARKNQNEKVDTVENSQELERIEEFTSEKKPEDAVKKASKNADLSKTKFSKAQLLKSQSLDYQKDVLHILLEDEKAYTLEEVQKAVDAFNAHEDNSFKTMEVKK